MPEWIKILLSALGGALVAGGLGLFGQYLRHKWSKVERYQEVLIEKRIAAYGHLLAQMTELHAHLAPIQLGAEPLRYPKDRRVSPDATEEEKEYAKDIATRISDLSHFVATNEMLLGPRVLRPWNVYYGALMSLRTKARVRREEDAFVVEALIKLLGPAIDSIANAIKEELEGTEVEFLSSKERRTLIKEGQGKAKRLLAEAKAKIGSEVEEET